MAARAGKAGVPATVHAIPDAGHGFGSINIRTYQMGGLARFDRIQAFLNRELAGETAD